MTNEEKARELALEMGQEGSFMYSHAMSILTKMTAWKEQQMIEKACNAYCAVCRMPNCSEKTCFYIHKFKQAMEE